MDSEVSLDRLARPAPGKLRNVDKGSRPAMKAAVLLQQNEAFPLGSSDALAVQG